MSKWFAQLAVELHILEVQLFNHVIVWNYCAKMSAQLVCSFIRPGSSLSPQRYISLQTLMV